MGVTNIIVLTKKIIFLIFIFISFWSYSQNQKDSIIYDINGNIYKLVSLNEENVTNEDYYDLSGELRKLYNWGNKADSIKNEVYPIFNQISNSSHFPEKLINKTNIIKILVSVVIEKNGNVSNFRIVNKSEASLSFSDILNEDFIINPIKPIQVNGKYVDFEINETIVITCLCTGLREKKKLSTE